MSDPIFEYNKKMFNKIFKPHPDDARDAKIAANQERREDRYEAAQEDEEDFDFERDCGARP